MAIGSPQWMYSSGDYELEQGLKFNGAGYLSKTPSSSSNRKTSTFSTWVKISPAAATGGQDVLFEAYEDNANRWSIFIGDNTTNYIGVFGETGDSTDVNLATNVAYRDYSAWYHIMFVLDTTQGTAANRAKLYVNNEQVTSFSTATYPSQNDDLILNKNVTHHIGAGSWSGSIGNYYLNGYMSETHFIDGQALTPADFGETGTYGEWKPIEYSGTYGTNGFYLPFKQDYTVEGFSAVTYKGTGATNYIGGTGFSPSMTWIKSTAGSRDHLIFDKVRGQSKPIVPNETGAEETHSTTFESFNTDGFTVGTPAGSGGANSSGERIVAWNWDMGADTPTGFSAVTYKGNGTAGQTIGGVGFQPDLVWIKNKTDADSHFLYDAVRGAKNYLQSDTTGAQATTNQMTAFNLDGFTVDEDGGSATNDDGDNFVAWCWNMGGTSVANTTGSINSTVRANPTYGQSIVSYTGNATSGATIGHGLSSTPEMIIVKNTQSTSNWAVLHKGIAADYETDYIAMNNSSTAVDNVAYWNDTEPTNQVFSVGNDNDTNQNNNPLIAYCFHSVTGYSKFGSYTGSGSSGKVVTTGFRPAFVMVKRTTGEPWAIADSTRNPLNPTRWELYASNNDADYETGGVGVVNMTDTGFTIQATAGQWNASGGSYIYMAFAGGIDSISDYNTTGSIDSRVKASTTYGQSIVSYTGNNIAGATIGHGLSSQPDMIIVKKRVGGTAYGWGVWHTGLSNNNGSKQLRLDLTDAERSEDMFNNAIFPSNSSTVFAVGQNNHTNYPSGATYIAYCFHDVTGYSKFGSYTGDGSTNGSNAVNCGFTPAFVMIKCTNDTESWWMFDSVRNPLNGGEDPKRIQANSNASETTGGSTGSDWVEFTSTGFKMTGSGGGTNGNGNTYIYMAFADKREYAYWLDQSGNNNDWTSNNLTESDISVDSPTNNFATWNPLHNGDTGTFAEGNLKLTTGTSTTEGHYSTMAMPETGKWYAEFLVGYTGGWNMFGIASNVYNNSSSGFRAGTANSIALGQGGIWINGTDGANTPSPSITFTAGDIFAMAVDLDNNKWYIARNNTWYQSANPSSGSNGITIVNDTYHFGYTFDHNGVSGNTTANFGQDSSFAGNKTAQGNQDGNDIGDFYYTPPTGFLALCTKNLPDVAVTPSEHFNTITYTGTDADNRAITGVGFQPDFAWFKRRNTTTNHGLFDVLRGANKRLSSNLADAEFSDSNALMSFDSDGYTVSSDGTTNAAGTYVAWNWKANGSGSSNTDGSITSTVSANVDAGFSIVTYSGNGTAGATIGHGLSKAPEMVIIKSRTNGSDWWDTYHKEIGADNSLFLNDTLAAVDRSYYHDTHPSSSVIYLGSDRSSNGSSETFVAYAFHSVDGYSKVGSYTGNGNADGTFVYTGFRPAFLLMKVTNTASDWHIVDSARDVDNVIQNTIDPNTSNAEGSGSNRFDFTSNGFKLRQTSGSYNGNGSTYIYIAFAETPFKYSNAR